jgi:flagellin
MASLFAQNSLANAQNNLATSVQRLSSGLRINSAKDDAAGLAISQSMQGQINGTNQSIRNLSDATNLLQTADSSLATVQDMLLRLKQLAVQGYDGSLSSSQKLDIVNEMKDLNDEINATATRTSFNGINLLSSGAYVSSTSSDIRAGDDLITTAVAANAGSIGTLGTNLATMGTATVYDIDLSSEKKNQLAGQSFTFTSSGDQLTMAGTLNGIATSQTVTVGSYTGNGVVRSEAATLDFDSFGVSFNLTTSLAASYATQLGSAIAASFASNATLTIAGKVATVSDIRLNGTESGTFTMSASAGVVEMSGTLNGALTSEKVTLSALAANTTNTIEFKTFGVKFDVKAYAVAYDATALGTALTAANVSGGTAGQLVINNGGNSTLDFQSGANSDEYIQINTLNVLTGDSGATRGSNTNMTQVGTTITGTTAGNLGDLNTSDTIATWQTAFKNAETAIDTALDYISTQRGVFGSQMNRLSYISTNLTTQSTNLQNSRSSIIDTDFAAETAKLTKGQIMQQAATAMLAQANQMPNVVLSLLK